jgi:hypothetical protein
MLILLTNVRIYCLLAYAFPVKESKIPVNEPFSDAKKDERLQSQLE